MNELNLDKSNIVAFLGNIFERRGAEIYLGEKVSMAEHMLLGAALVEASSSSDELITAILLHDAGHFTSELGPIPQMIRKTNITILQVGIS